MLWRLYIITGTSDSKNLKLYYCALYCYSVLQYNLGIDNSSRELVIFLWAAQKIDQLYLTGFAMLTQI